VGDLSCDGLTTGDGNVVIGADSDLATVTESNLVAIGKEAIAGDTGGISIGYQAGDSQVAGSASNTLIGYQAGTAINNGASDGTTAVGYQACDSVTSGLRNVCVGLGSDVAATTNSMTALGWTSLVFGEGGVAVGAQAEAGGGGGVSIGWTAGDAQAAADVDNVFIGNAAGTAANGTSTDNTCVGDEACALLTTADQVTAVGADAGGAHLAAGFSSYFGYQSGLLSTGLGNTMLGRLAGATETVGTYNTLVGNQADVTAAATSYGVAVGAAAQVHGSYGVAIGPNAEAGPGGIAIGNTAGDSSAAADGDNVFIGDAAGTAANGTSTDNTCVGDLACDALTTGDRNTLLGANTDVGTATFSDTTVIGESMVTPAADSILIGFGGRQHYYHHGAGKALVAGGADEVFALSVATISYTSATVSWVVVADDGSNSQSLAGMAVLWAVNVADTEDCNMEELTAGTDEATSSGTLTAVPTWVAGTNECVFNLNAASSLTETTLDAYFTVTVNGPATTITLK
jgi:hypothetical protein